MRIPRTDEPGRYVGLYVVDFGQQCAIGYTAEEVAVLLESEEFAGIKVYKVHRAQPDGTMELAGVPHSRFQQESGMFFYGLDEKSSQEQYQKLVKAQVEEPPPCRVQLQLAKDTNGQVLIALIYPAEYEGEMGRWLAEIGFTFKGPVAAGVSQVSRFYAGGRELLQQEQLWPASSQQSRSREELYACLGRAVQR